MGLRECTKVCWEMHGKAPQMGKNWAESRMICKCSSHRQGIREHQGRGQRRKSSGQKEQCKQRHGSQTQGVL